MVEKELTVVELSLEKTPQKLIVLLLMQQDILQRT
jgi:hypothetical protein